MSNDHDPDSQEFIELLGDPGSTWELAPSIIYTCDIDNATISAHRFSPTFVSHNTKDIFGYDASEILGHADSWREHMHPDDRSRIFSSLDTLFAQAKLSLIYRLRDKRGAYHLVRDELALVPDQTGAPTQIVGAFRNITLRKKAMEELEKYYAQYRKLFENIVDIYYRTDLDGRLQLISPSCLTQTGYTPEEVIGRPVTDFYADPAQREILLMALLEKEKVNDFEIKLVAKDGATKYASVTSHLIRDRNNGLPIGVEGILRDITERHQNREQMTRLLRENRALMLQVMQVQEDERHQLARELHDELGQLLTGISARAEYIGRKNADSDISSKADEIVHETDILFRLSHDILKRLRPASLDTLGLSAALEELIGNWNKQTGAACTLRIDEDIDHLDELHAIAIYRLVQEGLTNAYRHGQADRVDIVIQNLPQSESRLRSLQIEIEDNGKGIHVENVATGMGTIGMRERVHALGGVFLITDMPHDGVRIEATIPLTLEGGGSS